jgi:hypothetical protein
MIRAHHPQLLRLLPLLALWLCAGSLRAATFRAELDRDNISTGESAVLQLVFEGGAPTAVPNFPSQPNLAITYATQGRNVSFINGRTTSTITVQYSVTPGLPGDYTIPALSVVVNGVTLTSQPLRLRVTKGEDVANKFTFTKLIVPKEEMYVGEMIPLELQLFILSGKPSQMPQLGGAGFTFGKMPNPTQGRARIGNQAYNVWVFKTFLVAAKTGDLTLGPIEFPVILQIPTGQNDWPFGQRFEERPATNKTEIKKIKVLPLPSDGVPPSFAGAVGSFALSASVNPTNIGVGDPITIHVAINGRGALDSLNLPALDTWREFKIYPPTSRIETTDPLGMEGTKIFEQVVVPENTEVKELPPIRFSFFDPEKKSYRTLEYPATPLIVRPAAGPVAQPTIVTDPKAGGNEPAMAKDIVHIKSHPGVLAALQPPLVMRPGFLVLQSLPLLAWLAAFVWRKRGEHLANNPRLVRRRQVDQLLRAGVQDLRRFARDGDAESFFAATFRLLQERLGERLDQPAAAITEAVVEEQLRPRMVNAGLLTTLTELFQECNQARYAPHRSHAELASLLARVESTLGALEKLNLNER